MPQSLFPTASKTAATLAASPTDSLSRPVRLLTELDHIRICKLLMRPSSPLTPEAAAHIEDVLQNAELISSHDVPATVVTMYSQVLIADMPGGEQRKLTLCYPQDADPATGWVSVFSPVGTSLLGLAVGQLAQWVAPHGTPASARVMSVAFQPEESGDYLL